MRRFFTVIMIGILSLTLTGCMGTFKYKVPPDAPKADHSQNVTVAVQSFNDERPTIGGSGKMWFSWIPLMPFGWGFYNRPEDGKVYLSLQSFQFDPTDQLAQAAEMSLKYSGIFKNIYFIKSYTKTKPDYIFTGNIKSTLYRQKIFTYCLSFMGSLFWLVGAPAGWTENQIEIEFILKSAENNKVLWTYTAKNSKDRVHWFYYQGQDVKDFVPVMQKCMNEAINDLQKQMKNNPEHFSLK